MLEDILIPLAGMATGIILGLPVIRAVVRRIEGRSRDAAAPNEVRAELDQLRTRLEVLEQEREHVFELEERVDFAERMLTQQQERARLAKGDS